MKSAPPAELMKGTRFVVWKYEGRDGKETKVPYNPATGVRADGARFSDCTTFAVAQRAVEDNGYDGVGVVLGKGLAGADLDECLKDGNLTTRASEIVKHLNSYTEKSPSKDGVKIFLKGKKPGPRCRKGNIEIYDSGRFFTITGKHLAGTPFEVCSRTKELEALYYETWPKKPAGVSKSGHTQPTHNIEDSEIIEKALVANDGGKFQRLWQGDFSEYPSQSEADLALCNILAFWVGGDPARIDTLFRQSGLMRDKWDREDYRERTIQNAVDSCFEVYRPASPAEEPPPDFDNYPAWLDEEEEVSGKPETIEKPHLEVVQPQPEDTLEFPNWIMAGIAGDFAELYSSYLEVPKHFFYMAFLTCLGALIADRVTIASEIAPQPRLYTLLLGESADDRKSTAVMKVADFFAPLDDFRSTWGVNSAAGLQKYLEESGNLILLFDEFKNFVSKCKREGSVLLPAVGTLFESNRYEARTKKDHVRIEKGYLSLLAASTVDTYQNTWDPSFTDIGFSNRLWLVPGTGERKHSLPAKIPDSETYLLRQRLNQMVRDTKETEFEITPEAFQLYDEWYMNREKSIHSRRLGGYATRFMSLLTVSEQKVEVDAETISKIIALCNWQLKARQLHDPIDAEGKVARLEEKIRRTLKSKGPRTDTQLKRAVNYSRYGIWFWNAATRNLKSQHEIKWNMKENRWSLS